MVRVGNEKEDLLTDLRNTAHFEYCISASYREQGWKIVWPSVQRTQVARRLKEHDRSGDHNFEWSIIGTLKRPLPPGQTEIAATVAIKPEKPRP